jgi:hypothetical protein
MSIKATIAKLLKINIDFDKKLEIYPNGKDNRYTEVMELLKNNSITSVMSSEIMCQYIVGNISKKLAKSIVDNKGFFVKISYDANFEISSFEVLKFSNCRIGRKDSKEYNGKILYSNDWSDTKKNPVTKFNVYNPDIEILKYQIGITAKDKDVDIAKKVIQYPGQILYFNAMPEYHYPLARIDSVQNDCNIENLGGVYVSNLMEGSFLPRTLIVTRPLVDETLIRDALSNPNDETLGMRRKAESEAEIYRNAMKDSLGVRNVQGVMTMEVDFKGEKLEDAILIKNLDSNIEPDLFEKQVERAQTKILMAYNNLPISLIKASEGLFGLGGGSLKVAKQTYWENTSFERSLFETTINDLLRSLVGFSYTEYLSVLPLLTAEVSADNNLAEKQKAQAMLKGSVGGVTALLEIIRSVNARETDYNSALAIIMEIYGVSDATARQLLGTPNLDSTAILNIFANDPK